MIHDTSCECGPGAADIFAVPPTQTTILKRVKVDFHNVSNYDDGGPLEFVIPAVDDDYWDLNSHVFEVQVKITLIADNAVTAGTDVVGFVNLPLHSLFSQVDLHVNGELVTTSSNVYPYKAYIEKILSYSEKTLKCQFSSELYAKDTASKMDAIDGTNLGLVARTKYTKQSKVVTLRGGLHIPFLQQERYLINKCGMKLTLIPSNAAFCLMADENKYKVKITSARLELTKIKMSPTILLSNNKELEKRNAIYPVRRGEIKTFSIALGSLQVTKESLFTGKLPRRLVIGLLDSSAFVGNVAKNPYNFPNFGVNSISVLVDGDRYPSRALTPDFTNGHYVEAFQSLFTGTGIANDNTSLSINREEYANGYTLYVIQISPGEPDSSVYELTQKGAIRLEMSFKAALNNTITALVYSEFQDQIEIDRDRSIILDR